MEIPMFTGQEELQEQIEQEKHSLWWIRKKLTDGHKLTILLAKQVPTEKLKDIYQPNTVLMR